MGKPEEEREEKDEINLRIPQSIAEEARQRARARGLSLNAWICNLIARNLEETGGHSPFRR